MTILRNRKFKYLYAFLLFVVLFLFISFAFSRSGFSYSQGALSISFFKSIYGLKIKVNPEAAEEVYKDKNRINILILGVRGKGDEINGGLLTDTIMIFSANKKNGKTALISIPRDIYIELKDNNFKGKINHTYSQGGIPLAKKAVMKVTGIFINNVAIIDFDNFKNLIDELGGITIYLEKPFIESEQWKRGGDFGSSKNFIITNDHLSFYLPAGKNHLNGATALYYARSRYSTNDFDRMKRQQQILLAIKDEIIKNGFLENTIKTIRAVNILSKGIETDADLSDIHNLLFILNLDFENIKRQIFDTNSGLLYSTFNEIGEYILLPSGGNFSKIHEICWNILD